MTQGQATLRIDGHSLSCRTIAQVARDDVGVQLDPAALERAREAWEQAESIAQRRQVYGRTTGVGANRHEAVDGEAAVGHALRLLRSHAGGAGPLLRDDHVRATLVVRLNQLAAGGSGIHPRMLEALARTLVEGALPAVHRLGAIGTGDLTMLAEIGLTLAGERPWAVGGLPAVQVDLGDALALMSSNAATLAEAALACGDLQVLLRASHVVAALSYRALGGSPEAYAAAVHRAKPHPGQVLCASEMRRLLGMEGSAVAGRRIQDPFGLRAFPQVQGPALDSLADLERILEIEVNATAENPLVSTDLGDVFHHAHFHTAYVAVALDQARAALHHVAELSTARLGDLVEPGMTDLPPFLASGPPGSSGVMILEYVAQDALAQLRHAALPVTLGTAVVSRGLEDHASFSTQAARQATAAVDSFRLVLACELVAAVRALRMQDADIAHLPVGKAFDRAVEVLEPALEDRSLTADVELAAGLLPELSGI
ncbi:histidine ammonia-lyase [Nocardioides aromaticivorans]|uniref:Histidine ammonia-lyase n=1 Tax=Nocardioides aromaticivorans TaxID=200618 RepID=A0A7Z0CM71_9ACTN|nr:aromatic amino acid ammonia-lyase [Nocardioides aromaticivorans]NYI43530.1 histidine ammonia-lyase [Nocardioides aromaticivorans]